MYDHYGFVRKTDEGGLVSMAEVGTATVKIKADTSEFEQEIEDAFGTVLQSWRPSPRVLAMQAVHIVLLIAILIKVW